MKIGFVLFDNFHQRPDTAGSRIRGKWLIKYWPEAEEFVQGKDYDVVVYQKSYWKEHARNFKGVKILDICDPDWLDGIPVVDFIQYVDAVTVPTEKLKESLEKFTDKPVFVVKDRIDLESLPAPKSRPTSEAKSVVWFGYSHNASVLDPALPLLKNLGLKLIVVCNGTYTTSECSVESHTWQLATANADIQLGDIAILPAHKGRGLYKSENKETLAIALGLPVAKTADELKRLIDPVEANKFLDERYAMVMEEYDVKKSVAEMKKIVDNLVNTHSPTEVV